MNDKLKPGALRAFTFDVSKFGDIFAIGQVSELLKKEPRIWAASTVRDRVSELTVMTAIKRGFVPGQIRTWEESLRTTLANINERADKNIPTSLNAVTPIHFARWFILRPEQYHQYSQYRRDLLASKKTDAYDPDYPQIPDEVTKPPEKDQEWHSWLMLTVTFSGDLAPYIRFLSERVTSELDKVWGHCVGYPDRGARDYEPFWLFVRRHQIETDAFHASYTQLSPPAVHRLRAFKDHFDAFVARTRGANGESVEGIGRLFDEFLHQHLAYTQEFPGEGGLYNDEQADRLAEVRKCQKI